MESHRVLVWLAVEGERTLHGRVLPAGWVRTCSCGSSAVGLSSEEYADALTCADMAGSVRPASR